MATPPSWERAAERRWSGATSALWSSLARAIASLTASWVFKVQRFGSSVISVVILLSVHVRVRDRVVSGRSPAGRPPGGQAGGRDRHEIAPVLAVGLLDRIACSRAGELELGAKSRDLYLEPQHLPDALEVEPGGGQLL